MPDDKGERSADVPARGADRHRGGGRVAAIDVARGLAITGVVFNHCLNGLAGAGILDPSSSLSRINSALYIFRMPAVFFLIGLFVPMGVARRGARSYCVHRCVTFLYLYVIWFQIQGFVEVATGSVKNAPIPAVSLLTIWNPIAHLWFLPSLALATVVIVVTRPWLPKPTSVVVLIMVFVATVVTWGWSPAVVGLRGLSLTFFAVLGAAIGLRIMTSLMQARLVYWVLGGAAAAAGFVLIWRLGLVSATEASSASLGTDLLSVAGAMLGVGVLLALSVLLARFGPLALAFGNIGRRTLPIYLMHVMIVAGIRIALDRGGVTDIAVYIVLAVPCGVVVPIAAWWLANRCGVGWLFALPSRLKRGVARPSARPPAS